MASHPAMTGLADPVLLSKIDKFFELGIGEYVNLPQLLVVGDQSSGKSSVLEGLTGLPYPRDSQLCTRFATQITFRRSPKVKITVSIIPADNLDVQYLERLRTWKKIDILFLDAQAFSDILKEAQNLMGIDRMTDPDGSKKTFANDVLKIEISGPEQQHLSVIDVPGIFKKTTKGTTTKVDMAMVRQMVKSYMQNPRSVILAVIPANVDIATQEILEMAEEADTKGQRTLGVLTKPDLVDKGAENVIVDIIEGKSHPLNLGWCVVRNPGQQALTDISTDRDAVEKAFFKGEAPWNAISSDRVGVEALRVRLVEILAEMIKREFPMVKAEISQKLKFAKTRLENLGPSRATREQQFQYLLELANRFQTITSLALKAHYSGDDVFDTYPSLRLATAVVRRNASFSDDLEKRGHAMIFEKEQDEIKAPGPHARAGSPAKLLETLKAVDTPMSISSPKNGIKQWLESVYSNSRGFELGTFDASILPIVWKKQSANWEELALGYISDIVSIVHGFTRDLLAIICTDERTLNGVADLLLEQLLDQYRRAIDHTKFVLTVERSGTPLTTNHYFTDNLEKSRNARVKAEMEKNAYWDQAQQTKIVRLDAILGAASNSSNLKHTIDDLHDILKAYYKVARKRFVDVICMQAADYHLVTGPEAPMTVFSPKFVGSLSEEQLESIAGEDLGTKRKRKDLKRKIENLELGKKIALT